jgi:hypothetical protein
MHQQNHTKIDSLKVEPSCLQKEYKPFGNQTPKHQPITPQCLFMIGVPKKGKKISRFLWGYF